MEHTITAGGMAQVTNRALEQTTTALPEDGGFSLSLTLVLLAVAGSGVVLVGLWLHFRSGNQE